MKNDFIDTARKPGRPTDQVDPTRLTGLQMDDETRNINESAERYEFLTSITPDQFAKLYRGSCNTEFDDLVDELMRISVL